MRTSPGWTRFAASVLLLAGASAAARAQLPVATDHATFYVLMRGDTIGIEHVRRAPQLLDGELYVRGAEMRVHYTATLGAADVVDRLTIEAFRPASDSTPLQTADVRIGRDSVVMRVHGPSGDRTRSLAITQGALPYVNPSAGIIEQIARYARSRGDTVRVPLVEPVSGTPIPAVVRWATRDSATLSLGGVAIELRVDSAMRLQSFSVPSQGVTAVRVEGERPFGLVRADYSAPADAPYDAIPVRVHTKTGLTLGGTLTLPKSAASHPAPAVVTITGSGAEDRDEAIPSVSRSYRPFRDVADTLGRRGIAVLRLDDRGVGESEAGAPGATSADFADDIEAALEYLRTRHDIDASRLGLIGHSEGGAIAPMVAARDTGVRAIVLLAGPGKRGYDVSMDQNRYLVERAQGLTPAQRDSLLARARTQLDSIARSGGWLGYWLNYDPLATARRVSRAHVLILQGATDRQVVAAQAEQLAQAFRAGGNRDVTVHVFPATNHLFVTDSTGDFSGYTKLPDYHVRRDVLGVMSDWLVRKIGETPAVPLRK